MISCNHRPKIDILPHMGKRSDFERRPRDFYETPYEAVLPLLPHLQPNTNFCEPCAGGGALIEHLKRHGHTCLAAWDIEPQRDDIELYDPLENDDINQRSRGIDCFITNPPWGRKVLHPLIHQLSLIKPTWLLFDADWMHTKQSAIHITSCVSIVSIGRVKWIPDSKMTGKDNCCWYLFDNTSKQVPFFFGRQ